MGSRLRGAAMCAGDTGRCTTTMSYESELVLQNSLDRIEEILAGGSQHPVTVELLEQVRARHMDSPRLAAVLAQALRAPFPDESRVEWLAEFAVSAGDQELWLLAVTHPMARFERMLAAPVGHLSPMAVHAFIWKHAQASGHAWSGDEVSRFRDLCAARAHDVPERWMSVAEAVRRSLEVPIRARSA